MFCQNSVDDGQNDDRGEGSGEGDQSSISFVFADKKGVILPRRKYHTFFFAFETQCFSKGTFATYPEGLIEL